MPKPHGAPPIRNLAGQRVGLLTALEPTPERKFGAVVWRCRCRCGAEVLRPAVSFWRNSTRNGCPACLESQRKVQPGMRFSRLCVVGKAEAGRYRCLCDCGREVKILQAAFSKKRPQQSCGCLLTEQSVAAQRRQGAREALRIAKATKGRELREAARKARALAKEAARTAELKATNITGQQFGRLMVVEREGTGWRCRCTCGGVAVRTAAELRKSRTPSCGCFKRERGIALIRKHCRSGPAHHRWKGGVGHRTQDLRDAGHTSGEYRRWQRLVRRRARGRCECCGVRPFDPRALESHHINSVDKYPKQMHDVANGAALWQLCHRDFHTQYGFGQNTQQQFVEWLKTRPMARV